MPPCAPTAMRPVPLQLRSFLLKLPVAGMQLRVAVHALLADLMPAMPEFAIADAYAEEFGSGPSKQHGIHFVLEAEEARTMQRRSPCTAAC